MLSSSGIKNKSSRIYGSHLHTFQGELIKSTGKNGSKRLLTQQQEWGFKSVSPSKGLSIRKLKSFGSKNKPILSNKPLNQKKKILQSKRHTQTAQNMKKVHPIQQKPNQKNKQIKYSRQEEKVNFKQKEKKNKQQHIKFEKKQNIHFIELKSQPKYNHKQQKISKKNGISTKNFTHYKSTGKLEHLKTEILTFDATPIEFSQIQLLNLVGQGTFGKVYKGKIKKTGEIVAIKRVYQDPKYKNRQVQIVKLLNSDFTMRVRGTFLTKELRSEYLNIVMDFYDGDMYNFIKNKEKLSIIDIKIISYQIFRGLLYIHSLNICHRDIKPHNLIMHEGRVVICDFGSAKILDGGSNLSYICSRCYRAPELIFGSVNYGVHIDMWSVGCVILEMIEGKPIFVGGSSVDQLIEIMKVLGTPSRQEVLQMNSDYDLGEYKFPKIKKKQWKSILHKSDPLLIDLLNKLMVYSPQKRLNAAQALAHQFFDQIRQQKLGKLLEKQLKINLFKFKQHELCGNQKHTKKLIPIWSV